MPRPAAEILAQTERLRRCGDLAGALEQLDAPVAGPVGASERGRLLLMRARLLPTLDSELVRRATDLLSSCGDDDGLAEVLTLLALFHVRDGDAGAARTALRRALELTRGHRTVARGHVLLRWGALLVDSEGVDAARPVLLEARALFDALGDTYGRAWADVEVGVSFYDGVPAEACDQRLRAAQRVFEALDAGPGVVHCLRLRADLELFRERPEAALPLAREAMELSVRIGPLATPWRSWLLLGGCTAVLGRLEEAVAAYRTSVASWPAGSPGAHIPQLNVAVGLVQLGRPLEARAALEGAADALLSSVSGTPAAAARLCWMAAAGREAAWTEWDVQEAALRARLRRTGLRHPDMAELARRAALEAARHGPDRGWPRAAGLHAIALEQWRALDAEEQVLEEEHHLRALGARGAPIPLGRFDVVERLGRGGMAEVWRGEIRGVGVGVAIKVLSGAEPAFAEALRAEVRQIARLDHPGIIDIFDHGTIDRAAELVSRGALREGTPYLAMELATAGTLASALDLRTWRRLRQVLLGLLDALAHAHARGVAHLDLKPDNVLLQASGGQRAVKLADFGLARAFREGMSDHRVIGSPPYMAPEQYLGRSRALGPPTDLYALGCVAWELVAGEPPFVRADLQQLRLAHLAEAPRAFVPLLPVPPGLEAWLRRLLCKQPEDRYPTAADAAWGLLALADPVPAPLSPQVARAVREPNLTCSTLVLDDLVGADAVPEPLDAAAAPRSRPPVPTTPRDLELRTHPIQLLSTPLFPLRSSPLVGRESERRRLWDALLRVVRQRSVGIVQVRGPRGSGCSALAEWLVQRATELGVAWALTTRDLPEDPPPLHAMVERLLRTSGLEGPELRTQLSAALCRYAPGLTAAEVEALALQLGPGAPTGAVSRLLPLLTRERPAICWLDDVHADPVALRWVEGVSGALPVLFVLTVREEDAAERPGCLERLASLAERTGCEVVELEPLPDEVLLRLVSRQLALDPALASRLVKRAQGNPGLAIGTVRYWVACEALREGPYGFRLAPGHRDDPPADLVDLWGRTLERALASQPQGSRRVLLLAAVLGDPLSRDLWAAAATEAGLELRPRLLARLLDRRVLQERAGGVRFVSSGVRATLLEGASEDELRSAHAACAEVFEGRDEPGARARLGRHLVGAKALRRALLPLLEAAEEATAAGHRSETEALIGLWREAQHALGTPGDDPSWLRGLACELPMMDSRVHRDAYVRRARRLADLAREAGQAREEGMAHICLGQVALEEGALDDAEAHCMRALEVADRPSVRGAAELRLTWVAARRGQLAEAAQWAERAAASFEPVPSLQIAALCTRGDAQMALGAFEEALDTFGSALAPDRPATDQVWAPYAANRSGDLARYLGRFDEARERYELGGALASVEAAALLTPMNLALVGLGRGDDRPLRDWLASWGPAMRQECGDSADMVRALELAAFAPEPGRHEWDGDLAYLADQGGAFAEPIELAWLASRAGERAAAVGQRERARAAWKLAEELWVRARRAAEATEAGRRLSALRQARP